MEGVYFPETDITEAGEQIMVNSNIRASMNSNMKNFYSTNVTPRYNQNLLPATKFNKYQNSARYSSGVSVTDHRQNAKLMKLNSL